MCHLTHPKYAPLYNRYSLHIFHLKKHIKHLNNKRKWIKQEHIIISTKQNGSNLKHNFLSRKNLSYYLQIEDPLENNSLSFFSFFFFVSLSGWVEHMFSKMIDKSNEILAKKKKKKNSKQIFFFTCVNHSKNLPAFTVGRPSPYLPNPN